MSSNEQIEQADDDVTAIELLAKLETALASQWPREDGKPSFSISVNATRRRVRAFLLGKGVDV
jgi:hypothetical protein